MPLLRAIATTLLPLMLAWVALPTSAEAGTPMPAEADLPGFTPETEPADLPPLAFSDGGGRALDLSAFSGRVVLLNLWATWCGPCRAEMPALDRLQARFGGGDFQVVAVSVDQDGAAAVQPFLARFGLGHLGVYLDPDSRVLETLGINALPTSLLIDRGGRLLGEVEGDPGWDSPEARQLIEETIAAGSPPPPAGSGLIRTGAGAQAQWPSSALRMRPARSRQL